MKFTMRESIGILENVLSRTVIYNGSQVIIEFDNHPDAVAAVRSSREVLSYMRMVDRGETNL